jgi:hypothetical protein
MCAFGYGGRVWERMHDTWMCVVIVVVGMSLSLTLVFEDNFAFCPVLMASMPSYASTFPQVRTHRLDMVVLVFESSLKTISPSARYLHMLALFLKLEHIALLCSSMSFEKPRRMASNQSETYKTETGRCELSVDAC